MGMGAPTEWKLLPQPRTTYLTVGEAGRGRGRGERRIGIPVEFLTREWTILPSW